MKQLIIIGAGGFGREMLGWAKACPAYRREWEIAGFLDDRPEVLNGVSGIDLSVIGNTVDYEPGPEDVFVCAIGDPAIREEIFERFTLRGATFARVIHESCIIGRNVELGPGVVLCPGVILTSDLEIGKNTAMNLASVACHDSSIGDHCQISNFCDITGYVSIGNTVMMGSRASVLPGRKVGDRSIIGAGSVVVSDVPDSVTVFGNPAKILTRRP